MWIFCWWLFFCACSRQLSFVSFRMVNYYCAFSNCLVSLLFGLSVTEISNVICWRMSSATLTKKNVKDTYTWYAKKSEKKNNRIFFPTRYIFVPLLCQRSMNHCFKNKFGIYWYLFDVVVKALTHRLVELGLFQCFPSILLFSYSFSYFMFFKSQKHTHTHRYIGLKWKRYDLSKNIGIAYKWMKK